MSLKRKAVYTVQSKSNSRAKSGIRSCCAARTWRPPQEAKVPYFADPLCFTRKNFETKEVKNLHCKKLENYRKPQEGAWNSLQVLTWKNFVVFVNFLLQHHFVALILIHSVAAKGNHERTHVKSSLRKRTAFSAFSAKWSLQSFSFSKVR